VVLKHDGVLALGAAGPLGVELLLVFAGESEEIAHEAGDCLPEDLV
jgi:hypothetical protein